MNKILKTSLTILGILFFCILLKSGVKLYNVIGVVGLYGSVYYFMILNSEGIENFYLKEIMTVLISYNLQKNFLLIYKEVYKNKLFLYTNIMMFLIFCILFIYNLLKDKKICLKNILDLGYEFLIISMPFYVIKGRGRQTLFLMCVMVLLQIVYKKEYVFDKRLKNIYISLILFILFCSTSFLKNDITFLKKDNYSNFMRNILYLLMFFQMKFDNNKMKKISVILISASILRILPILVTFIKNPNFTIRLGYENPNNWSIEAIFWTLIFLYSIFFKKRKEFFIIYLLFVLGVYLSGSRGGFIVFFITNIVMLIYKYKNKIKELCIISIFGLSILVLILNTNNRVFYTYNLIKNEKKIDNSSMIRVLIYKEAWEQFKIKPINGIGFDGYRDFSMKRHEKELSKMTYIEQNAYTQWHTHNNFLGILSSTGILGFASYIITLFFICKKLYFDKSEYRILIVFLITAYQLYGITEYPFHYYKEQIFLYFLIGLYIAQTTPKVNFSKKEKLK